MCYLDYILGPGYWPRFVGMIDRNCILTLDFSDQSADRDGCPNHRSNIWTTSSS